MLKIQNRKNHEKEIYYIKRLLQEKRDTSDYGRNMIIIMLKLYIITHIHTYIYTYTCNKNNGRLWPDPSATTISPKNIIIIVSPHMLHCELFRSDQIKFKLPNFNSIYSVHRDIILQIFHYSQPSQHVIFEVDGQP